MNQDQARERMIDTAGERLHKTHVSWARSAITVSYRDPRGQPCYQCATFARIVLETALSSPSEG